jgi:hypothetical protein
MRMDVSLRHKISRSWRWSSQRRSGERALEQRYVLCDGRPQDGSCRAGPGPPRKCLWCVQSVTLVRKWCRLQTDPKFRAALSSLEHRRPMRTRPLQGLKRSACNLYRRLSHPIILWLFESGNEPAHSTPRVPTTEPAPGAGDLSYLRLGNRTAEDQRVGLLLRSATDSANASPKLVSTRRGQLDMFKGELGTMIDLIARGVCGPVRNSRRHELDVRRLPNMASHFGGDLSGTATIFFCSEPQAFTSDQA